MGNLIHLSFDYQDLRYVGMSSFSAPFSLFILWVTNVSLIGFPFLSGFYSKDMIIESALSGLLNLGDCLILMFCVSLTFVYSFRIIIYIFKGVNSSVVELFLSESSRVSNFSMVYLFPWAGILGGFVIWLIMDMGDFVFLPFISKIFVYLSILVGFFILCLVFFLDNFLGVSFVSWSRLLFLPSFSSRLFSEPGVYLGNLFNYFDFTFTF